MLISNSALNNNSLLKENQHWQQTNSYPQTEFTTNPLHYFVYLVHYAPKKIAVLNAILHYSNCYNELFPSQESIAARAKCSRQYVNMVLKEFAIQGILVKVYRKMESCIYKLNPLFYLKRLREKLKDLFPAFRWVPRKLLIPFLLYNSIWSGAQILFKIIDLTLSLKRREIYIYPSCLSVKHGSVRARGADGQGGDKKWRENLQSVRKMKPKRRTSMEQFTQIAYPDSPIPPYIREVTEIPLSKWGQMKLTCFPADAVSYARGKIALFKKARNPFGYFFASALEYCKSNDIRPDWGWMETLCQKYGITEDKPLLLQPRSSQMKDFSGRQGAGRTGYKNKQEDTETERALIQQRAFRKAEETAREVKRIEEDRERVERENAQETPESLLAMWEAYINKPTSHHLANQATYPLWNSLFPEVKEALVNNEFPPETISRLYAQYPALQSSVAFERERLKRDEGKGNATSHTPAGTFGSLPRQSTDTGTPVGLSSQIQGIMHNKVIANQE